MSDARRDQVRSALERFIGVEILQGQREGLDADTPLLAWGVIDSLAVTRLIAFVHEELGVEIPLSKIVAAHFKSIRALSELIVSLEGPREP